MADTEGVGVLVTNGHLEFDLTGHGAAQFDTELIGCRVLGSERRNRGTKVSLCRWVVGL